MSTVTASADVAAPISIVYDQWTRFESFPEFMTGVEQVQQLDDTHSHWRVKVGPVEREFYATITEQLPYVCVSWRSDSGPRHAGVVNFHRIDDETTRVTTQMEVDPEGFLENVGDKLGLLDHRVNGDLVRFKTFVEDRAHETGSWR